MTRKTLTSVVIPAVLGIVLVIIGWLIGQSQDYTSLVDRGFQASDVIYVLALTIVILGLGLVFAVFVNAGKLALFWTLLAVGLFAAWFIVPIVMGTFSWK